jgi:alkylated DNA repair dioxygenase AlkB
MSLSATVAQPGYADVVDLGTYPIHDLGSEQGRALIARCRQELTDTGVCNLPGFIRPEAVARMVEIAGELAGKAWQSGQEHTVYFEPANQTAGPGDPRRRTVRSAKHGIAYDYIPAGAPVRRLYESDDMTAFIAAALGKDRLYRSADPLDALQITAFEPGDELGWHFDRSEFSVTVMYQTADSGGEFVYVPGLRSDDNPNYDQVAAVLAGDQARVRPMPNSPGTLAFFHGHDALHRVTPVTGSRPRINSVLTYGEVPGMRLNDLTSKLFYRRTSS